jgi:succinyl-diaminopimelate desuccinylase
LTDEYEIELLAKLVEINTDSTTKQGYAECAKLLEEEASKLGLEVQVYDAIAESKDNKPRPNVVVDLDVRSDHTLLLVTHYDIVPAGVGWKHDPFKLTVEGEKAYGRGAADDKGAIAAALGALSALSADNSSRCNVSLLISPDEEVGGDLGIGYLVNRVGVKGDGAVILDAGPEVVSIGASGAVWGKITVRGLQGHAGYPHTAVNAVEKALPFLTELCEYAKKRELIRSKIRAPPGSPYEYIWGRFSITMLQAGQKENIIPGRCEARFDLRVCPDEDSAEAIADLTQHFQTLKEKHGVEAELDIPDKKPSNYHTDPEHPLVKAFSIAAKASAGYEIPIAGELGGNDGHYLARVGVPVVSFGPIRQSCNFHGVDEFIYLSDLKLVKETVMQLCRRWV